MGKPPEATSHHHDNLGFFEAVVDVGSRSQSRSRSQSQSQRHRLVPMSLDTPFRRPVGAVHIWLQPSGRMASLSWDLLVREGTPAQREAWNALRLRYVARLYAFLRRACRGGRLCAPAGVGTTEPLTTASDVDINLNFDADSVRHHLESIDALYDSLRRFHRRFFAAPHQSAEALFDLNVYGSDLRLPADAQHGCDGPSSSSSSSSPSCAALLGASPQQRLWGLLRLAELPPDGRDDWLPRLLRCDGGRPDLARDVLAARKMLRELPTADVSVSQRRRRYLSGLRAFFVKTVERDVVAAAEAFSRSKLYEHETYRSAGAYLHIVGKRRDLTPALYRDSAADNLGFALENLLASHEDVPFDARMLRVAKYVERVADALLLALASTSPSPSPSPAAAPPSQPPPVPAVVLSARLRRLQRLCARLNALRKRLGGATQDDDALRRRLLLARARGVRSLLRLLGVDRDAHHPEDRKSRRGPLLQATRDALVRSLAVLC